MTKRILALVIAALMMVVAFASCESTPATKTPATTTKAPGTKAPETKAPETKAPETKPATPVATTPATSGGEEPAETDEDIFGQFGGLEMMFEGDKYGEGFEIWPSYDKHKEWAPMAFLQGTFVVNKSDVNAKEGMGTDDYQYRFCFYIMDVESETVKWTGPYSATCLTYYDYDANDDSAGVIYRPLVSSTPEGNLLDNFELGKEYFVVMQIKKGDEALGFTLSQIQWSEKLDNSVKFYNYFWEQHNRDAGYTANDGVAYTDADWAKAKELGFDKKDAKDLGNDLSWVGVS